MVMSINAGSFSTLYTNLDSMFKKYSSRVETETWQGRSTAGKPDMVTHELLNVTMGISLYDLYGQTMTAHDPFNLDHWRSDCRPHLPWADNHFAERVGGEPLNPGATFQDWRHGASAATFLEGEQKQFNHTYMERMWPKYAGYVACGFNPDLGPPEGPEPRKGIRHEYGDLMDVVHLLSNERMTRQAYLPLFFPEDTGKGDGGRKPCTLGYQFILRQNRLHIYYPMRSCDYANHFRDDCYLAVRLLLWVIEQCRVVAPVGMWDYVMPGSLTMHCTSFHLFANDYNELTKKDSNIWAV